MSPHGDSTPSRTAATLLDTYAGDAATFATAAAVVPRTHTSQSTSPANGPLEAGQHFGPRYRIVRLLGAGGMGAVYEAWDHELNVTVALKVIRLEASDTALAQEIERRFKQELVLARQVTHRNVVRIHDLGEIDGIKYLTMTFVEGADLASVLRDAGRLDVATALKIARQIAAGLQAAHEAGVIHRDLKPANIMIDGDQALIVDFGIARSSKARQATAAVKARMGSSVVGHVTTAGSMLGTVDYMAPEQATGQTVDQRVDIYAFGLIFYDMLLGGRQAATGGVDSIEALRRRIEGPPAPVSTLRSDVPSALERVITKCVQPDRELRYQSAAELIGDLDRLDANGNLMPTVWRLTRRRAAASVLAVVALLVTIWWIPRPGAVEAPPDPVSVLVADFENRTNDKVFDGALEHALTIGVEGASFITTYPRQTAQQLAKQLQGGSRLDADTARLVAVREEVKVVLAGSIEPARTGYAVTTTILNPLDGRVLGTRRVTAGDKASVLGAVGTLAADIRKKLGDKGSEAARRAAAETFTASSLDAVREYAVAQDLAQAKKDDDALDHYRKAIAADPKFGRAYSGLAVVAGRLGRRDEAEAAWKTALSLTDRMTDREKYRTLGTYYMGVTNNYDKAIDNYTKLLEQYPADTSARNNLAVAYVYTLQFAKAVDAGRELVRNNPKKVLYGLNLTLYAMYAGQFDAAAEQARKVLAQEPTTYKAYLALAAAALASGDKAAVQDAYAKMSQTGSRGASLASLGLADFAMYEGRYADARTVLLEGIAVDKADRNLTGTASKSVALAEAYAALGDRARAAAAAQDALRVSRQDSVLVTAAETLIRIGSTADARALVSELAAKLQPQPRAYARMLDAQLAMREKRLPDAIEALQGAQKLADLWLGRYLLGVTYLEAGYHAEALSELEASVKRGGEATAIFFDEMPSFRRLVPVPYWLGRAQEGLGMKVPAVASYDKYLAARARSANDPLASDAKRRTDAR